MKKTIKVVAVAMVALMLMLALVSCGATPKSDIAEAKKALEDNGYTVMESSSDGAKVLIASKGEDTVSIAYYDDQDAADAAYKAAEEALDAMKELADAAGEELNVEVGQSGTMVWSGTPDAIKAAS